MRRDSPRWADVRELLDRVEFIPGAKGEDGVRRKKSRLLSLLDDKLIPESTPDLPLVVVVSGGTNVGKSSLVNWLAGTVVSPVSALARGTKIPVLCGSVRDLEALSSAWIPGRPGGKADREASREISPSRVNTVWLRETERFPPPGCVLIDSPDFDSNFDQNRWWADRLVTASDALIMVVTPEKYNDAAVIETIQLARNLGKTLLGVFNKRDGDEAWMDFVRNVWERETGPAVVVSVPRLNQNGSPAPELLEHVRSAVQKWIDGRHEIKSGAVRGTRYVFRKDMAVLLKRLDDERIWLKAVVDILETTANDGVEWYRRELKKENFVEVDRMFRRLMEQYRIRIIDDVYGALRKGAGAVWNRIRSVAGMSQPGSGPYSAERLRRETIRVQSVAGTVQSRLFGMTGLVPDPIRHLVQEWVEIWRNNLVEPDIEGYLEKMSEQVDGWIETETQAMAVHVREHPNLRRFLVTGKLTFQVGFGLIGAYLMGGFNPGDVILAPALERLAAILMETGLGKAYFLSRRRELLRLRCNLVRSFIEETWITPFLNTLPASNSNHAAMLRETLDRMPGKAVSG